MITELKYGFKKENVSGKSFIRVFKILVVFKYIYIYLKVMIVCG